MTVTETLASRLRSVTLGLSSLKFNTTEGLDFRGSDNRQVPSFPFQTALPKKNLKVLYGFLVPVPLLITLYLAY